MNFAGRVLAQAIGEENAEKAIQGFAKDFSIGRERTQEISNEARKRKGLPKEMPQIESYFANHPTQYRVREALGLPLDPKYAEVRNEFGEALSKDTYEKYGQLAGTIARDVVEDGSRALWWLLNAPQAAVQVLGDLGVQNANMRKFYDEANPYNENLLQGKHLVLDNKGNTIDSGAIDKAVAMGLGTMVKDTDKSAAAGAMKFQPKGGVSYVDDPNNPGRRVLAQNNYSAVAQKLPLVAAGLGVNTAVGLMNPFGGAEGYKAVMPSDEDPSKTENILGEIATKYILGYSGGLLPYSEFVKVRPDVSPEEYKAYKAYKGSRGTDLNPLDGDFNIAGVLKGTDDGIHGSEINFLGRSIPTNTGLIPIASSILGAAAGSRLPKSRTGMSTLTSSTLGGFGGLAVGNVAGGLLEAERRRRNEEENLLNGSIY